MFLSLIVSLVAVAAFGIGLWRSGILPVAHKALSAAMSGISAITDSALDDDAKEVAARRAAISLFAAVFTIVVRFALILAVTAIPIYLADLLQFARIDSVISLMLRVDFILLVSVLAIVLGQVMRRSTKRKTDAVGAPRAINNNYSDVEKFLHGIAFSSPSLQRRVSRVEDWLIAKPRATAEPPIFVTSLARGGTTALLNALAQIPGNATHTYRDMPFLTAPILWDRLAGGAKRSVVTRERAHGDGLSINLDSPEAFEEVIWKMHWSGKYTTEGIALWTQDDCNPDAEQFLSEHMIKIIRARYGQDPQLPVRYCSKNNANICRLEYLPTAFPESKIIIPLRQPARHAESLHRQHINFLTLQKTDDFVRKYMSDIGHFEFGRIYTPMMFPGFAPSAYAPEDPNHWLNYWISAFQYVETRISDGQKLILVAQDSLRRHPQDTMKQLIDRLGLPLNNQSFEKNFRSSPDTGKDAIFCPVLLGQSQDIFERLCKHAL